jgi:hypothetical protein
MPLLVLTNFEHEQEVVGVSLDLGKIKQLSVVRTRKTHCKYQVTYGAEYTKL